MKEEYKDMFGIYLRVKEIRPTYVLVFNKKTKKVELIDKQNNSVNMSFEFPITPDILVKINKTKVENCNKIFAEIDTKNRNLYQNNIENAIYFAKNTLKNN